MSVRINQAALSGSKAADLTVTRHFGCGNGPDGPGRRPDGKRGCGLPNPAPVSCPACGVLNFSGHACRNCGGPGGPAADPWEICPRCGLPAISEDLGTVAYWHRNPLMRLRWWDLTRLKAWGVIRAPLKGIR